MAKAQKKHYPLNEFDGAKIARWPQLLQLSDLEFLTGCEY